jgi:hypothetical protein
MCVCMRVCMYVHMYVCMHHTYVCMYVCMYVYTYVCIYSCMYIRMYTYIRMYACMYTCIYTIHLQTWRLWPGVLELARGAPKARADSKGPPPAATELLAFGTIIFLESRLRLLIA